MKAAPKPADVPVYIASFPPATRKLLRQLRSLIQKSVPGAEEKISYGMPGYKHFGMFAYFAGYKNHVGFYPGPRAIEAFQSRLARYKTSKGTVQFPLDKPLPLGLLRDMLRWMRTRNEARALTRKVK